MATLILLVILVSAAGFVAPRPVSACSCAELDPAAALADYPAAFVGKLVDVDGQLGAVFRSDADTIYRFEVETWVKGDLGTLVEVHAAASGASCGIEVGIGNRAGIFLNVDGDQYSSSLCETIDADVLLASLEPLETGAAGPPRLFVSARVGGFDYLVVNERGGIVSALAKDDAVLYDSPWRFSKCPDSLLFLELSSWQLTVRDRTDLSVVRRVSLEGFAEEVGVVDARCMNADGSSIWVVGDRWVGDRSVVSIYEATDGLNPIFEIPAGQTTLGNTYAIVQEFQRDDRVLVFDYETGESTTLHTIQRTDEAYVGVASIAPSPDGSTIALLEVTYDEPDTISTVILYDPSGQEINRIEIDSEGWWVDWIDEKRIMVYTSNPDFTSNRAHVLSTPELEPGIELENWQATDPVLDGETLYGRDGPNLMKADLVSGSVTELATYATQYLGPIALLPADFELAAAGDNPATQSVAATDSPSTVPPATSPPLAAGEARAGNAAQFLIAGIALLGVGVFVFNGVIKRRRADHSMTTLDHL